MLSSHVVQAILGLAASALCAPPSTVTNKPTIRMGNLCGKESSSFDTPGQVLGSAPNPPSSSAQIPPAGKPSQKPKISGKGKTLGSPPAAGEGSAAPDARAAAARAAEV